MLIYQRISFLCPVNIVYLHVCPLPRIKRKRFLDFLDLGNRIATPPYSIEINSSATVFTFFGQSVISLPLKTHLSG